MNNSPEKNTKSPDEYWPVNQSVLDWLGQYPYKPPVIGYPSYWWKPLLEFVTFRGEHYYLPTKFASDNLIDEIRGFFKNIWTWTATPFADLYAWITNIWKNIEVWYDWAVKEVWKVLEWIWEKIKGTWTLIGNTIEEIWWWVYDFWDYINLYVIDPLVEAWDYLTDTLAEWLENIRAAIAAFLESPFQWALDLAGDLWESLKDLADWIGNAMIEAANIAGSWIGGKISALAPQITEYLRDVLFWVWEHIKEAYYFVKEQIAPAVWEATTGAVGWLKDEFTNLIGLAYKEIMEKATSLVPVTPERSAGIAAGMFGAAVGFGALAHGMALSVEAIPNLKYMGVHYLSAFVARMGSFGTISSATMGVIAALAIREPFGYYMKSILRPTQPREMDLQMMAVKPDINLNTFRQGMKYQGYSDFWIDAFERTMYHEPRYFELSMLGEDEAATDEWLYTKARRGGYSEDDAVVFVSSLIKKVTRDQRKEFYKQAFNAFKEGYISIDQFKENLDYLGIRPEAKELSIQAAKMAYEADLYKELVSTYQKAFTSDLITEEEYRVSLSTLGMTGERIDAIIELEWVKKRPKILKAERKEIEAAWRDIQAKYSRVYIESFRRGLITEDQLATYLAAIGMEERAARATARYEAIKLIPKAKPEFIQVPLIPAPPAPPTYED
ncbi:hypothetical protein ES708_13070 [subsurface metagenome]